ncbi:MCE family protein [Nocardia speluncae]|uniref:MCE family protein n=1 Tax=Nocardia speluncae TaxID=419477 RepID=A0A846XWF4_9NOCA|nr:MCE family protein [Nocardia speluncae]NKY37844.1 MCE family protein [Nocardia speluncae]
MIVDHSGRGPRPWHMTVAGLVMLTVLAVLLGLLGLRYTGRFEDSVLVRAVLTSTGDGLPERADVKFRGMVVGAVSAVDVVAAGKRQQVAIDLDSRIAPTIPDNVTARVVPNNLFGVTGIELVDNGVTPGRLAAGAEIAEDTSAGTVQLQTTLTVLRDVLDKMQPEKLGRVLATFSEALDPAARAPGSTIERLDTWVTEMRTIEGVGELLGDLGRATTALSESAPELVGVLSESVTTARTVTERRENLVTMLANAGGAVDSVNSLFARNPDAAKELVPGLDGLFGALAQDPEAIPTAVADLNTALGNLSGAFGWGAQRQMRWSLDVSFTPFQQYTAKDCPRYGEMAGPRCGGPSVPQVAPVQQYPPNLLPGWLPGAGPKPELPAAPAPNPALPQIPGLPVLPGLPILPAIPGITAPLFPAPAGPPAPPGQAVPPGRPAPAAAPAGQPISRLRGHAAVAALLGRQPTTSELLLLTPVLAGGTIDVYSEGAA